MHFSRTFTGAPTGIMQKAVFPNGDVLWAYPPPAGESP
jgi:hypothetical protein